MEKLLGSLQTKFGTGIALCENGIGIDIVIVPVDNFLPFMEHLHGAEGYDYLVDIAATHWVDEGLEYDYEVVYNLYNVDKKTRLFVKVRLADPEIPSVYHIYKSADFVEREQFDMVGVVFTGHPNLKRIYMPDYFEGHPLLKTYGEKDRSWFNLGDEMGHGLHFTNLGEKHESEQPKVAKPVAEKSVPSSAEASDKSDKTDK